MQTALAVVNRFRKPGTPAIVPADVGSTDANDAIAMGIPAVAIGATLEHEPHRLEEYAEASSIVPGGASVGPDSLDPNRIRLGRRQNMLTAILLALTLAQPGAAGVTVRIETSLGHIDVLLDTVHAPITTTNFLKYVDGRFYDGGRFHRATRPDNYTPHPPNRPAMAIVQGGIDPARRSEGFPPIPLERTSVTGLRHVRGTISMARAPAADTATSDFFICLDAQPSLDFGGKRFDDHQGAAAFGRVIAGMDVVARIQRQPTKGQSLDPPIPILRIVRLGQAKTSKH